MIRMVVVSALPERLPWVEGTDYQVLAGVPKYGDLVRTTVNKEESFFVYTDPGTPYVPKPNTPNNPYFGNAPMPTEQFWIFIQKMLGAARMKRLTADSGFIGIDRAMRSIKTVDPDDKDGLFLKLVSDLTSTSGEDGKLLLEPAERDAIMGAWPLT